MKKVIFLGLIFLLQITYVLESTPAHNKAAVQEFERKQQNIKVKNWHVAIDIFYEWALDYAFANQAVFNTGVCRSCNFNCHKIQGDSSNPQLLDEPYKNIDFQPSVCKLIQSFNRNILSFDNFKKMDFFVNQECNDNLNDFFKEKVAKVIQFLVLRFLFISFDDDVFIQNEGHFKQCALYDLAYKFFNSDMQRADIFDRTYVKPKIAIFCDVLKQYSNVVIKFIEKYCPVKLPLIYDVMMNNMLLDRQMTCLNPELINEYKIFNFVKSIVIRRIIAGNIRKNPQLYGF